MGTHGCINPENKKCDSPPPYPPTCVPSQTLRNKGISSDVLLKMLFPSCGHLGNCSRRLGKLLCFGNSKCKMYFTDRPNVPFKSELPHPGHTVFQLLLFQGTNKTWETPCIHEPLEMRNINA